MIQPSKHPCHNFLGDQAGYAWIRGALSVPTPYTQSNPLGSDPLRCACGHSYPYRNIPQSLGEGCSNYSTTAGSPIQTQSYTFCKEKRAEPKQGFLIFRTNSFNETPNTPSLFLEEGPRWAQHSKNGLSYSPWWYWGVFPVLVHCRYILRVV